VLPCLHQTVSAEFTRIDVVEIFAFHVIIVLNLVRILFQVHVNAVPTKTHAVGNNALHALFVITCVLHLRAHRHANVEPSKIHAVEKCVLNALLVTMIVPHLHQEHVNVEPFKILAVENYANHVTVIHVQ